MTDPTEFRSHVAPIELRGEGSTLRATGVAMRYGARSKPINGQFREVFAPGAFVKTIGEQDVRSHNEHEGPYLGRSGAGTLRLVDSPNELAFELDLPDTTAGRDAAALLSRGDIKGASIGFRAVPSAVSWSVEDGLALRTVSEAQLGRVDLTVAPAYDDSTAALALRSLADERDMELRSLLEVADRGELPTLISSPPGDEAPDDEEEEGRETPTIFRQHITWMLT